MSPLTRGNVWNTVWRWARWHSISQMWVTPSYSIFYHCWRLLGILFKMYARKRSLWSPVYIRNRRLSNNHVGKFHEFRRLPHPPLPHTSAPPFSRIELWEPPTPPNPTNSNSITPSNFVGAHFARDYVATPWRAGITSCTTSVNPQG